MEFTMGHPARCFSMSQSRSSSTSACWQAQAGAGVAVVDRAAVAGGTFGRLAVRPFRTAERLPVALLRNRHRPPSVVQEAFCEAFDRVWREEMGR